jgi:hypothetical protein
MAAATAPVQLTYEIGDLNALPMKAASKIYQGTAVSMLAAGTVAPLTAAEKFVGFAVDTFDNTAGAASAKNAVVKTTGMVELTVVGLLSTTQAGVSVYASDDSTFTLTAAANSIMGKIHRVLPGAVKAIVTFNADLV